MQEIVKYANDFNYLAMPNFTEREMDIFMAILSKLKYGQELELDREFFAPMSNTKESLADMINLFNGFADKIFKFNIKYTARGKSYAFVCFDELIFNHQTFKINIKAQDRFYELITNYQLGFTRFELLEFMGLSGKYAKTLYRLLKQYKHTGELTIFKNDWQGFCDIMGIPESYPQHNIDARILKPALKELSVERNLFNQKQTIFKNLKYEKKKDPKGRGRGGKVVGIIFTFDKQPRSNEEEPKSEELQSTTQQKQKQIKSQRAINFQEQLKNLAQSKKVQEPKINPFSLITGKIVNETDQFLGKHFKTENKLLGGYDTCKVQELSRTSDGKIFATMLNQETRESFIMDFESVKHLENFLNKY